MYKGLFKFRDLVFIVILIVNGFILGEGFFLYFCLKISNKCFIVVFEIF